ncbi:MAG TPA: ABATE domain-containing protein [Candidatus Limnocylindria bacterium]|nr:ABATE domain-containing protein [Candidatus Limnocylindria bacterium]
MRNIPPADHPHEFVGGALALDFTNTLGGTHRAPSHDHLQRYDDLVEFGLMSGSLCAAEAYRLRSDAKRHPIRARDVLQRAITLREGLWRIFEAMATGRSASPDDVTLINREIAPALGNARLVGDGGDFRWGWTDESSLERPLWPIARSAAELLTSAEAQTQVRECASETCEWLFLDRTRNHSRRWCDMNDCGARAKMRRFRAKRASERAATQELTPNLNSN